MHAELVALAADAQVVLKLEHNYRFCSTSSQTAYEEEVHADR